MKPGLRIGHYEVLDPLGQGGMGTVYRVRHSTLGAERALKLLLNVSPRQLQRFEREVLRLAQVRHPNVVSIHDTGLAPDGRPYFVMDLLDGRTIDEAVAQDGVPSLEQGLEWAIGICAGVQALHDQGVVHRDLKPQNVFLTRDGRPVVLDVGLAVDPEQDERMTKTGALVGTLNYMAPEQFSQQEPSPRTDVYALGLILHELVTGVSAVSGSGSAEVIGEILQNDRPLPSQTDPSLPRALDRVAAIATARDPDERYADAGELGLALRDVLEQPGLSRRAVRILAGVAAALVVASLGVAFSPWGGESIPEPGSTPERKVSTQGGGDVARLRRLVSPEARVRAARAWLAAHPDDPGRAEVEPLLARSLDRWGRERLRALRGRLTPDELYLAVQSWQAEFGSTHKNAEAVEALLAAAARKGPIKRFESSWFAAFLAPGQAISASPEGARRWDLQRLVPLDEEPWLAGQWVSIPDPQRRGLFTLHTDRRNLAWYDMAKAERRPFARVSFPLRQVRFSPGGTVVALRGFSRFDVRKVEDGALVYQHVGPAEVRDVQPDDAGHVAIVYWGTIGHAVKPPPVLDIRRMKDDHLLKRHNLVGSGAYMALAPDRRTLAVATSLGRVYLFDLLDPAKKRVLVGADLADPERGMADPPGVRGFATSVAFGPQGRTLFAVSNTLDRKGGDLRAWDVASGRELLAHRRPYPMRFVAVAPDGRSFLVTGDRGAPFELWLWRP